MAKGSLFAGMAKAEVSSGRTPKPKIGKAWYLISQVANKTSRKNVDFISVDMTCINPISDKKGSVHGSEMFEGELPGTRVSTAYFSSDEKFASKFKSFILTCMGKSKDELDAVEAEVREGLADKVAKAKELLGTDDEAGAIWCVIGEMVCGEGSEAGCFDGTVVVEVETKENVVESKDEYVKNAAGELVPKVAVYENVYFQRAVSMSEVAGVLDKPEIKRYFGTEEQFDVLLQAELED